LGDFVGAEVIVQMRRMLGELSRRVERVLVIALGRLIMLELVMEIVHIILNLVKEWEREVPRSLSVVSKVCNLCGGLLNR
jgi:hypothetical protein